MPSTRPTARQPRAAVVCNPTKVDDQRALRRECEIASKDVGWAPPLWIETTKEDPGVGQAMQALAEGVDIVFAAGGDGTVRLVGSALADGDIPLGLMPSGTGNLLARNLGVPHIGSSIEAFARSLVGYDKRIDVGRVHATFDDGRAVNDTFLIMAGYGLDGDIMDSTSEQLKKRLGWMAYPAAGVKYITERPERMLASFDDRTPRTKKTTTLLVGNCGTLTAGVSLMPDAEADDGELDGVWLSADGPLQWAALSQHVLRASTKQTKQVEHLRMKRVFAQALGRERALELDGDILGRARSVEMWVSQLALPVRMISGPVQSLVPTLGAEAQRRFRRLRRTGSTLARRAGELGD